MTGEVVVRQTDVDGYEAVVRELLVAYFERANEQGRAFFDDEAFGADPEAIVAADLERLRSAAIEEPLFLAFRGERVVGTVQVKRLDGATAEVKRLYVRPTHRGEGVGQRLVEAVLAWADGAGFGTLRLGVAPYHEAAQSLYRSLGFEFTGPYEQSQAPAEIRDDWRFMAYSVPE